jgi:SAM-dependent methyltransferase
MQSGLYTALQTKGLIIAHEELNQAERAKLEEESSPNTDDVYCLLKPTQIAFQSYPFEWSYSQWRKAIIVYININQIALKYGMILKDATPYNFYLEGGKAILLDTSSFAFFTEGAPWIAYRQFCAEFLSPLALMHYNGQKWSRISKTHLRGLPLNFVSKQLPLKSWFNSTALLHIHLHSKYANAEGATAEAKLKLNQEVKKEGFSKEKLASLMSMLLNTVTKWKKPYQFEKHWSEYYEQDIASEKYLVHKEEIVKNWLEQLQPLSVLDLGANTGKFSFLAAPYTKRVIAMESDDICVDLMEAQIKKQKLTHVNVLLQELAETSPNRGLNNKEIISIFNRAKSEMVLALAVEHHLHITNHISLSQIGEMFSLFSSKYLITEFIPKNDSKVQLLIKNRNKDLSSYTLELYKSALEKYFNIIEETKLAGSDRILILLQKL